MGKVDKIFGKIEDTIYFNFLEVGLALLKMQQIHEGRWHVGLQFDTHGAQVNVPTSKVQSTLVPTAMVTVLNVNLRKLKDDELADALTLDAAEVNPRPRLVLTPGHTSH